MITKDGEELQLRDIEEREDKEDSPVTIDEIEVMKPEEEKNETEEPEKIGIVGEGEQL